jgi:hypothetical protein
MLLGIYSAIYGEVNVSVSGGYMLQYVGGTGANSCFISVTLKTWSGRNILDPTTYIFLCYMPFKFAQNKVKNYFFFCATAPIGPWSPHS